MASAAPDNSIVQPQSQDELWTGRCSFGCYHARGKKKKCKCRCGGKLHGKARENHLKELKIDEIARRCDQQ
jgi:hypothetical protein